MQSMSDENAHNDELFDNLMNKRIPEYWKNWSRKFQQNVTKDVYINGSNSEKVVSNAFPTISVLFVLLRTTTAMLNTISMCCVLRSQMIILARWT